MTMKALMPSRTTRNALIDPTITPTPAAIASETGSASHAGLSSKPAPAPPVPKTSAVVIAASAMHQLDRKIHVAGDQRQRQPDRDDADEGRLLQDVEQNPDLQELRDRERERRQHDDQDEPDEIVEHELDDGAPARRHLASALWRQGRRRQWSSVCRALSNGVARRLRS